MKPKLYSYIATLLAIVLLIAVSGCRSTWNAKKPIVPAQSVPECPALVSEGSTNSGTGESISGSYRSPNNSYQAETGGQTAIVPTGSTTTTYKSVPIAQGTDAPLDISEAEGKTLVATGATSVPPPPPIVVPPDPIVTPSKTVESKITEPLPTSSGPSPDAFDGRDKSTQNQIPNENSGSEPSVVVASEEPEKEKKTPFHNASLEKGDVETPASVPPVQEGDAGKAEEPATEVAPSISAVSDDSSPTEQIVSPDSPVAKEEKEPTDQPSESNPEETEKTIGTHRNGKSYAVSPTVLVASRELPPKNPREPAPQEMPIRAIIPGGRPAGYSKSTYTSQPLRAIVVPDTP